jgi:hypothetical protein
MAAAAAAGGTLAVIAPVVTAATTPTSRAVAASDTLVRSAATYAAVDAAGTTTDGVRMLASVAPVVPAAARDEPLEIDVSELVKAVGLADEARLHAERQAAADCDADLDGLGRVKPWVRDGARFLSCLYDEPDLIGVAGRARDSDHPRGLALDLMVRGDRGDRIASCALANQEELGVDYVIWEQRVNHGDGWERMSDRGGDTENHYDHVHVSFERGTPDGAPLVDRCDL